MEITDEGIGHLAEIESLVSLNLGGTQVTDRSLDRLRNLPNLQWVWAGSTKITPEAIERFNRERGAVVVHDGKEGFIPPP
jgi:phosphoglycerate dehydrogenase-like enzyme